MARRDNRDVAPGAQCFGGIVDGLVQAAVGVIGEVLARRAEAAQFAFPYIGYGGADADNVPASIRQFLHEVFDGAFPEGAHHLDVEGVEQVARGVEQCARIVVAAHEHDVLAVRF